MTPNPVDSRVEHELKLDELRAKRRGEILLICDVSKNLMTVDDFIATHNEHDQKSWWGFERKSIRPRLGPWQVRQYHRGLKGEFESDVLGEEWLLDSQGHHLI